MLFSAVITAVVLTGLTEGLSLFKALDFFPVAMAWFLLTVTAGQKVFKTRGNTPAQLPVNFKIWSLSEKLLLGTIIFVCAVTAITAAVGMPNTWDAMSYHLSRVEHWMQDKTIAYYPTNMICQLYVTPWAEFAIAHARILGGGESSANFVQWMAMAGSLMGVSLIAGQLGANRTGQLLASVIAVSLPMGILQSVSTQTDYVCAFWLIVFAYFLIEVNRAFSVFYGIAAGLSLGLAILTKGNSYILSLPFLIWFLAVNLRKGFAQGLLGLLLMVICAGSLNMGQYIRNTQTFGSAMWTSVVFTNSSFDLKVLWVNLLRDMSIHLATPFADINESLRQTLARAAQIFGGDINDTRSTFLAMNFAMNKMNWDEDYSGNFIHTIMFTMVFVLSWFYRGPGRKLLTYGLVVVASFLLFTWVIRYQPWLSRFHLPLFILFCPVAGTVLGYFLKQKSIVLSLVLLLGALPWLFLNIQHPWVGGLSIWKQPKPVQYFYKRLYFAMPYASTADYVKSLNCKQVGLLTSEDDWEYPWWKLLQSKGLRIEHVGVSNLSSSLKYPLGDFQPCAIIVLGPTPPLIMAGMAVYGPAWGISEGSKITVFLKKF